MTHFEREIREQPGVLAQLLQDPTVRDVTAELGQRDPRLIITLARGSSDNAVTFFAYLAAQALGLPVASLPPSLLSVYAAPMQAEGTLAVGVSQSGESSDVVEGLRALRRSGALTVALSNDPRSSLTDAADYTLLQHAGLEQAVAASKTFTSQMLLLALLVAHWGEDEGLLEALRAVPEAMAKLLDGPQDDLQEIAARLTGARSLPAASKLEVSVSSLRASISTGSLGLTAAIGPC